MRTIIAILLLSTCTFFLNAQEIVFKVEITSDSLYFGNLVGIKYIIENAQGDFEPPEFSAFELVGGPNVSNQFSMINGAVSQSSSYEYILQPLDIGTYTIASATLLMNDERLESEMVTIAVIDNPNGIRQDHRNYTRKYSIVTDGGTKKKMTKADSIKQKLRKLKARKI